MTSIQTDARALDANPTLTADPSPAERDTFREYKIARAHLAAAYQRAASDATGRVETRHINRYNNALIAYARTAEGQADLRTRTTEPDDTPHRTVGDLFRELGSDLAAALGAASTATTEALLPDNNPTAA